MGQVVFSLYICVVGYCCGRDDEWGLERQSTFSTNPNKGVGRVYLCHFALAVPYYSFGASTKKLQHRVKTTINQQTQREPALALTLSSNEIPHFFVDNVVTVHAGEIPLLIKDKIDFPQ